MVSSIRLSPSLLFLLALINFSTFSQVVDPDEVYPYTDVNSIRGSRFLYDDFIAGTVYFDNKTKATDLPLRLNIYHDELQYVKDDSVYALASPNRIDRIVMGGEIFTYLDKSSNSNPAGFVRMWSSRFPAIITKMSMGISGSTTVREGAYNYTIAPRFERKEDQHYLMHSESNIVKINSVEHLIYLLCYYSPELEEFAQKEKISASSGADLAWLLKHFQTVEPNP